MRIERPAPRLAVALILAAALGGCEQGPQPATEKPKEADKQDKSAPSPTDPRCVGPVADPTGAPLAWLINGLSWELDRSTIKLTAAPPGDFAIGVLTDIKEDTPENKANLEQLAAWFTKSGAQFILVAGDTGTNADQIVNALSVLAATKLPVFTIIGNREGRSDYKEALDKARKSYSNVFDLNTIRRIDTPVVDVLSMPGYFDPKYIHAADGCTYQPADVRSLWALAKASNSPTLLVSHGPPRQDGALALDRTSEGQNVGDPELTKAIRELNIPFGVFGNIHEAGGRATDLAGQTLTPPGTYVSSFYLNPGPADGVRWLLNDGTESIGMAALITFKDGKAKYEIDRLSDKKMPAVTSGKKSKGK